MPRGDSHVDGNTEHKENYIRADASLYSDLPPPPASPEPQVEGRGQGTLYPLRVPQLCQATFLSHSQTESGKSSAQSQSGSL